MIILLRSFAIMYLYKEIKFKPKRTRSVLIYVYAVITTSTVVILAFTHTPDFSIKLEISPKQNSDYCRRIYCKALACQV